LPGSKVTVQLAMIINESNKPVTVGITEYLPSGWTASGITLGGLLKSSPARIEWLFWSQGNPVKDQMVNYSLWAPSNNNGTYNFSGTAQTETEDNIAITGDNSVLVGASCPLIGDFPPCGTITLSEVVSLINLWSTGGAKLSDVVALVNAWSAH
jgi:hypothetical protein